MVSVGVYSLIGTHRNHTLLSLLQLSIYFISFLKKNWLALFEFKI